MATKRQRFSGTWEYVVKRKHLLPGPIYLSFTSESEGDQYVGRLKTLLDNGIVPDEFKTRRNAPVNIADLIRALAVRR